jgi:hypothetical protein
MLRQVAPYRGRRPGADSANALPTLAPMAVGPAQGGGRVDVRERIQVRRNRDRPFDFAAA